MTPNQGTSYKTAKATSQSNGLTLLNIYFLAENTLSHTHTLSRGYMNKTYTRGYVNKTYTAEG